MTAHVLLGFDYVLGRSVERPRKEWRDMIGNAQLAGGFVRYESGETFIHKKGGTIMAEIYSHVYPPNLREAT